MNQATKKEIYHLSKRCQYSKELGHWEGKYWCDCCVRGYRFWLGQKLHGIESMDDIDDSDEYENKFDISLKDQ